MTEYLDNDKSILPGAPVFHSFKTERNHYDRYNPKHAQ